MIFSTMVIGRCAAVLRPGGGDTFAGQARLVVIEQSAVFDDVLRDRIETVGELGKRNLFAARMRSIKPKSVEVSSPMFCEF